MYSEIEIHKINGGGKVKAFAGVTIAETVRIYDLRIVCGKNGLFVSPPQRKSKNKNKPYYCICRFLKKQEFKELERMILEKYQEAA